MELPILYKNNRLWKIKVDKNANIITEYGMENGKLTSNSKKINKGKNIGKANETTPYEQAIIEIKSKWKKKKDSGFNETKNTTKKFLPMLATNFVSRKHNINYPCYIQPKLDGVRAFINIDEYTNIRIMSRTGKEYVNLHHIKKELDDINIKIRNVILDGELYSKELTFEEITGICRKQKIKTDKEKDIEKKIQFWIFDCYFPKNSNIIFKDRFDFISKSNFNNYKNIKIVKTFQINKEEKINSNLIEFIHDGYEGIMIRNNSEYEINKRSKDLQKYKNFQDSEYKIIDFCQGTGNESGCIIWICQYNNNNTFHVRPRGSHKERKDLYKEGNKYIGKLLTVRYQELTENGCPRFPVGITIRDYE